MEERNLRTTNSGSMGDDADVENVNNSDTGEILTGISDVADSVGGIIALFVKNPDGSVSSFNNTQQQQAPPPQQPNWLLIGGIGAAVLLLIVLLVMANKNGRGNNSSSK